MTIKRILFCTFSIVLLCSCQKDYYVNSYISGYNTISSVEAAFYTHTDTDGKSVADMMTIHQQWTDAIGYWSEGEDKKKFDSLCELFGDNNFRPGDFTDKQLRSRPRAIYPAISVMTVTSDLDFDEAHPADTPDSVLH